MKEPRVPIGSKEVMIRRVLLNGVTAQPGRVVTVTGNSLELAVQMDVVACHGGSSSSQLRGVGLDGPPTTTTSSRVVRAPPDVSTKGVENLQHRNEGEGEG